MYKPMSPMYIMYLWYVCVGCAMFFGKVGDKEEEKKRGGGESFEGV